ncbi:protein Spindly isoform X2 [Neoarius graeffei]|uniref:protein Spindly isoform X2 n=1 Tax=Neoarius graeffei TaxID=443677 RepID=UPI00298C13C1|nr:protein Spindly isoform X2 [Neoarius graeffei]
MTEDGCLYQPRESVLQNIHYSFKLHVQKMSLTESEIQRLQQKVEEAEEALQKAAQYGLQLLDDKMDLQNKLEDQRIEMTTLIEGLEQEKYSLQREVELKSRMLGSLNSEFDVVKNQQKHLLEQQQTMLERIHAVECGKLKNKVDKLRSDLDEAQLLEKQLRHKLELQSQTLTNKTEELRKISEHAHETTSSEMLELQIQKLDLESCMAALEQKHQDLKYKEQQLELANGILQRQLETLANTMEEKEKEVVSLYTALEKSREANQNLQIQLDLVLQQAQDPNSKGNSLFSEVEDKRAEIERQLISVKVQHQSLQKQHAFTKQQMLRMKVQISNVMQLQGIRADPVQLERLHFMLSEKNSEIETLMKKVQQLEKVEVALENQSTDVSKETEFVDETYYTDLLKMQLSNSKKFAENLKEELYMARMKTLSESNRVLELERKLFATKNALKQGRIDIIKLQVKTEELLMKYEPNEANKTQAQKCKREKFPVNFPDGSDHSSMDTPGMKTEPSKNKATDGEALPCSTGNKILTPVPLSLAPSCSSVLLCDTKCLSVCEDATISIPDSSRSSVKDTVKYKKLKWNEEGDNWRSERCKKYQAPVHVDSENTMERQCAQQ